MRQIHALSLTATRKSEVTFLGHELLSLCALHPLPRPVQGRPYILDGRSLLDLFLCHLELNFVSDVVNVLAFRISPNGAMYRFGISRGKEREREGERERDGGRGRQRPRQTVE